MNTQKKSQEVSRNLEDALKKRAAKAKEFPPMSLKEVEEVLGLTIKKDSANKVITFLSCLSAYTDDAQFNLSFNAPSSSGKSYIPIEISSLFPEEDVIMLGHATAQAFYHDTGKFDKEKATYLIDLERKILIFMDQPSPEVLQRIRPLLSHDKKEIQAKITDKTQKYGLKTKTVILRGFPSVIFCSASLRFDEQEATRFILLSPEISQEKLREGIKEALRKVSDSRGYHEQLVANPLRRSLMERIKAIRGEKVRDVKIHDIKKVEDRFFQNKKLLKPRYQRDVKRVASLIKTHALLNVWHRERVEEDVILTNDTDIDEGFRIWELIGSSQELNLPPYVYAVYEEVILPFYAKKGSGLTRKEILQGHFSVYERPLEDWRLRREILPMLEMAGLITQEQDPDDKRCHLIVPVMPSDDFKNTTEGDSEDSRVE